MYPYQKASVGMKECVGVMSAHSEICRSHELFDLKVSSVGCYCEPAIISFSTCSCDLLLSPNIAESFATSTNFQYHLQYHSTFAILELSVCLVCHVGHDSGMLVFKLERERPAYTMHQNTLYYVKVVWPSVAIARKDHKCGQCFCL